MYAGNHEQAVKIRGIAGRLRRDAGETADSYYRRIMQLAALELEGEAERLERTGWRPRTRLN